MITAEELIRMTEQEYQGPFKLGIIVGDKVQFDGEDVPSQKKYARMSNYTITNGDRVLLVRVSGTYVILGKVIN